MTPDLLPTIAFLVHDGQVRSEPYLTLIWLRNWKFIFDIAEDAINSVWRYLTLKIVFCVRR
jgi:hypothetical protein